MSSSEPNHETEIKLRVEDAASARRLLQRNGFVLKKRRVFERNTVYDTSGLLLRRQASLLRIRQAGRRVTMTFKGRPEPGRHKSREEIETRVAESGPHEQILSRLGFQPVFRYEKYRTEYGRRRGPGVVTLDETPIGVFFEIEGPAEWIDKTAARLGFTDQDYVIKSYAALYFDYCRQHGREPGDMVFE